MKASERFEAAEQHIRELDSAGIALDSEVMACEFRRRNSLGIDPGTTISRIWRREFLEADMADNRLSLPKADRVVWNDPLENPLAGVRGKDDESGLSIDYGAIVRRFYGQCWSRRSLPSRADWDRFSPGNEAVWVSTTVAKLLDRLMLPTDNAYMHRTWLVEVEYKRPEQIRAMMNPDGVLNRLDPSGVLLALSAATVRSSNMSEDELRLVYNASLVPLPPGVREIAHAGVIHIPFDWTDFIDDRQEDPRHIDK